jgi:hypothetical protein
MLHKLQMTKMLNLEGGGPFSLYSNYMHMGPLH